MASVMHKPQPYFKDKQSEFVAYIREPEKNAVPAGIKKQRMNMYRELFFNNINSFLTSNFPVLRKILDDDQWNEIAQGFFSKHSCGTPYFSEIPEEFIQYLQHERESSPLDPPFMLELAHYEWVEMALSISKDELPAEDFSLIEKPLEYKITLSPLAWPLVYQYPVNEISSEFQPSEPPGKPTYLVVYRNPDFDVKFVKISPLTFGLLHLLQESGSMAARDCLKQIASEAQQTDLEVIIDGGAQIIKEMAELGIICKS